MNLIRIVAPTAALALSLGGLAACGASSDDVEPVGSPVETVSEAEFAKQGNALCRANGQAIASMFESMSRPPKPAEFTAAYETILRESYKITGDVLAIGAPEGKEQQLIDLLVELQAVTEKVEAGGQEAFFADESDPWAAATATLVEDFGLTDCAHQE